jgi:hypothetical protein
LPEVNPTNLNLVSKPRASFLHVVFFSGTFSYIKMDVIANHMVTFLVPRCTRRKWQDVVTDVSVVVSLASVSRKWCMIVMDYVEKHGCRYMMYHRIPRVRSSCFALVFQSWLAGYQTISHFVQRVVWRGDTVEEKVLNEIRKHCTVVTFDVYLESRLSEKVAKVQDSLLLRDVVAW